MSNPYIANASAIIDAPVEKVWQALTEPELIKQYMFGTNVTTDWQVGSPITYAGEWEGKPYVDKGQILEFEPNKRLVSTFWSALSGTPDQPENYQTVRYELTPQGSVTRLMVSQDNLASDEMARDYSKNWEMVLEGIKTLLS
jgi:uncharacterized protein YndB with AHSA1/START domain